MEKGALFAGEKWLPYRKAGQGHFFTVHSTFNRVINISTDQGLLSVAAENIGASSAFLTVSGRYVDCGATVGQRCFVRAGQMHLANSTINFKNAAPWKGPISKGYRHGKIKEENITAFKAVLDRKAPPQSAWRIIHGTLPYGSPGSSCGKWSGFGAIRKLRENPLLARNLVGLGQGLTPTGDDMLTGFLAMVNHAPGNGEFLRKLYGAVLDSLHKTVDISAQMLSNALDCDYHEYVQNCIRDVCEGEKEAVYMSAASLLKVGATSGADIACGMYFGMLSLFQNSVSFEKGFRKTVQMASFSVKSKVDFPKTEVLENPLIGT